MNVHKTPVKYAGKPKQPQKAGPRSRYQEIAENGRHDDGLIHFLILSLRNPVGWLSSVLGGHNVNRTILTSSLTLAGPWGRTLPKQASDLVECRIIRQDPSPACTGDMQQRNFINAYSVIDNQHVSSCVDSIGQLSASHRLTPRACNADELNRTGSCHTPEDGRTPDDTTFCVPLYSGWKPDQWPP